MKTLTPFLLLAATLPLLALAQDEDAPLPWRQSNLTFVASAFTADQALASSNTSLLARRGLLADQKAKTIRLWAEATGLESARETEFFLISEASGHDYEALAVSFAKPGDVREALLFLGLPPGRPVDAGACRFWPKGERVLVTFRWTPPSIAGEPVAVTEAAAEPLVFDKARKGPLPAAGFVFTGSRFTPDPATPAKLALAADLFDPHSIASDYNDPDTILDVPRQASKNAVYGWQFPNPDYRFAKGQLIEVTLRPERTDGSFRVRDLTLQAAPAPITNSPPDFTLSGLKGGPLKTRDAGEILKAFQACTNRWEDPFVAFTPDRALPLKQVRLTCALLDMAEAEAGARVEPPAEGQLFFRAFLPDDQFRDRAAWVVKPGELNLVAAGNGATGTVTLISESWSRDNADPDLVITNLPVASPAALKALLAARKRETPVMVVHAPETLTYGVMADYAAALLPTHPTVWVFLKD